MRTGRVPHWLLVGGALGILVACGAPPEASPTIPAASPTAAGAAVPISELPLPPRGTSVVTPIHATPLARQDAAPAEGARAPGPATPTGALAGRFEAALNTGDVDGVLALFTETAEVKVPPDRYVGLGQIRNWVIYLAANRFAIEPGFRQVVGDRATWSAEVRSDYLVRLGLPSLQGTASLLVQDERIQAYTFVLTEDSAHRHRTAQLAASQVLQDPVIVGQDAANVYGFTDVFRDGSGRLVSYRDVLLAEPGIGTFYDLGGQPIVIRSGL
jgi:hypothetical protein